MVNTDQVEPQLEIIIDILNEDIDEKHKPLEEVGKEDTILGYMSENEKKLYAYTRRVKDNIQYRKVHYPEDFSGVAEIKAFCEILEKMMWFSIFRHFSLFSRLDDCLIEIKKGWLVVASNKKPPFGAISALDKMKMIETPV